MRKLIGLLALALLCAMPAPAVAQIANVTSEWVDGDLYFYDKSKNEIFHIDAQNRKMVFPSGSNLDLDAATGILSVAAGEFSAADLAAGSVTPLKQGLGIRAGTALGAGDLVYLSSYNAADGVFIALIADADVAGGAAQYVATGTIANGATGTVYRSASVAMDTSTGAVGDPIYATITGTTTNTKSLSAPSGADDRTQIVGRVQTVAAGGTVLIDFEALAGETLITGTQIRDETIASADILNGTIANADTDGALTGAALAADTLVAGDIATGAVATAEILDGTILNEDVGAAAAIARSKLAEDALQAYGIPISEIRSDAGASLTAAETAGTFDITVGTNTIVANGEVTDNETEVSVAYFQFVLPPEYVAAGDVTIRMPSALIKTGAPTDNGSTLDIAVFEQSDAGAVGSDLSTTTPAATYAALDTWYNKDFVITAAGLVAGDVLNVKITSTVIDSEAGAGTIILNLAPPKVLVDIKG